MTQLIHYNGICRAAPGNASSFVKITQNFNICGAVLIIYQTYRLP